MFTLRPFQAQALQELESTQRSHSNVLCIAPTGSGKSLIYEKAAAVTGRKTLLVSPLIALARQQQQKLLAMKVPTFLNMGQAGERPKVNQSGVWIVSPEILLAAHTKQTLHQWQPDLLVVDECHCLWEWGEDFRPAFQWIPSLLKLNSLTKSLWLTATLPHEARQHLKSLIHHPLIELGRFDLPASIFINLIQIPWKDRIHALRIGVLQESGYGIIFVNTRESTLKIQRLVNSWGKSTLIYHGGMSSEERKNAEELIRKQVPEVIIATSAFGMGMDYTHLNYVILWQLPTSILSLVQTIGRVGRNSKQIAKAHIFWSLDDFQLLEWSIKNSNHRRNELKSLVAFINQNKCRRSTLRRFFDPQYNDDAPCDRCDFCLNKVK